MLERSQPPAFDIARITAPKSSDVLAEALRARIRSREWPEGTALPTERDLARQTSLSRTTVREALRILELDGLIEIRPGRGGGARVRRPGKDELTRQLELFIWGRNVGVDHLHDVRSALEALGAKTAALARTDADVQELIARTEAVESSVQRLDQYLDANLAWHMAVVRASHNELLVSFMEVLSVAIHEATESEIYDSPDVREATLKIHRSILKAIIDRDPEAARRRMARHVTAARDVALQGTSSHAATVKVERTQASRPRKATTAGKRKGSVTKARQKEAK